MKIENPINLKQVESGKQANTYKVGQVITAKIAEIINEGHVILQDLKGNTIEAKSGLQLKNSSEYFKFTVTDIDDGMIYIKMQEGGEKSTKDDKIITLLKDMGFKANAENLKLVKQLINHGIPVTKDNIGYMQKVKSAFNKVLEIINPDNLMDSNPVENDSLVNSNETKDMGLREFNHLKDKNILEVLKTLIKDPSIQSLENNGTNRAGTVDFNKLAFLLKNNLPFNLENIINTRDIIYNEFTLTNQLEALIKNLEDSEFTKEVAKDLKNISVEFREMVLNKDINLQEINKDMFTRLLQLLSSIQSKDENISNQLENIKESLEFIGKVNQYQTYLQLPIQLNDVQKNLELYIMNNKKSKSQSNNDFKIFLSLDTNYLDTVQAMIEMSYKSIHIEFFLTNEEVKRFFAKFENKLKSIITEVGYENVGIDFTISNHKKNLITLQEEYHQHKYNAIDVKV